MNYFFTADTHFNHANIIKYSNRPFTNVNDMNDTLINNWNSKIGSNDIVYHLGDFAWSHAKYFLDRLNGNIIFVEGNHDKSLKQSIKNTKTILNIKINGQDIVLCHFAMRVWDKSHFNSWHLYGHSHNTLVNFGKSMDVGVDTYNYYPYSFDEIKSIMDNQPDNFNLVRKQH